MRSSIMAASCLGFADLTRACTLKKTGRQEFFQDILSFDQGYAFLDTIVVPSGTTAPAIVFALSQLSYCSEHARCGSQFFFKSTLSKKFPVQKAMTPKI